MLLPICRPTRSDTMNAIPAQRAPELPDAATVADWDLAFARMSVVDRVRIALREFPGPHVLSSSFGAQAAVSLHLLVRECPSLPVVLIDTGYLFPETYHFVDELTERLQLDLRVYRSVRSPAWQEARYGQRWLQGVEGIEAYNRENKVEPMQRALRELGAKTWFSGLRRVQAQTRAATPFVQLTLT